MIRREPILWTPRFSSVALLFRVFFLNLAETERRRSLVPAEVAYGGYVAVQTARRRDKYFHGTRRFARDRPADDSPTRPRRRPVGRRPRGSRSRGDAVPSSSSRGYEERAGRHLRRNNGFSRQRECDIVERYRLSGFQLDRRDTRRAGTNSRPKSVCSSSPQIEVAK